MDKNLITCFANDRLRMSVTNRCNYNCYYCSNEGQDRECESDMDVSTLKKMVKKIISERIYIRKVNITGGEPLLHRKLIEIINNVSMITESITLNTNGILLDENNLYRIANSGVNCVKIGLDSLQKRYSKPSNKLCDPVDMKAKILDCVAAIPGSSLNIVVTEYNINELQELIEFVLTSYINRVEVLEHIPYDFENKKDVKKRIGFQKIFDVLSSFAENISYNPRLGKYYFQCGDSLMIQLARDFCAAGVCGNLWTRLDSNFRFIPCIKGYESFNIDWSSDLIPQIKNCNSRMCIIEKNQIPQDYKVTQLKVSLDGEMPIRSVQFTNLDP